VGVDVSSEAVALCEARFKHDANKSFTTLDQYVGEKEDLFLSLDVIYHLVKDSIFYAHTCIYHMTWPCVTSLSIYQIPIKYSGDNTAQLDTVILASGLTSTNLFWHLIGICLITIHILRRAKQDYL